jgi:hypothetical protein
MFAIGSNLFGKEVSFTMPNAYRSHIDWRLELRKRKYTIALQNEERRTAEGRAQKINVVY